MVSTVGEEDSFSSVSFFICLFVSENGNLFFYVVVSSPKDLYWLTKNT